MNLLPTSADLALVLADKAKESQVRSEVALARQIKEEVEFLQG